MNPERKKLELLAPAKNADFGIEAVKHGADAVYIGGPAWGARAKAPNSLEDIARLVAFAHRYYARVYVALNTIIAAEELDRARQLIQQFYDIGVDALIVQDMAILEMDIPPIALHASTQTDIRTVQKAQFLDQVGFSQLVLAREMDLPTIHAISKSTDAVLEYFVHGALCVAFSGQCYISYAHTGRSANRGECSQECRLPYRLEDAQGRVLGNDKHFLSVKDNDQSANLRALIDAGVSSFKIEGRYKDLPYVKNTTAHYRLLLDEILLERPDLARLSSGKSEISFTPQPEKTFNRSATDYFTHGRQADIGAFDTPKFAGEEAGRVIKVTGNAIQVDSQLDLHNGDGLCFFDVHKELVGMRVNRVEGNQLIPNEMPADIRPGTLLYRNRDHAFMRQLEKPSAQRKIPLQWCLSESAQGFILQATDDTGMQVSRELILHKQLAKQSAQAKQSLLDALQRLGNSDFYAEHTQLQMSQDWFIPASNLNALRREVIEALLQAREDHYPRPTRRAAHQPPAIYPEDNLSYLANVYNPLARQFYHKHGVKLIAAAYEENQEQGEVALMITKHCLRYSHAMCPKEAKGVIGVQGTVNAEPMTLISGNDRYTLKFDCKPCEMHVMGKLRKHISQMPAQPMTFFPVKPN